MKKLQERVQLLWSSTFLGCKVVTRGVRFIHFSKFDECRHSVTKGHNDGASNALANSIQAIDHRAVRRRSYVTGQYADERERGALELFEWPLRPAGTAGSERSGFAHTHGDVRGRHFEESVHRLLRLQQHWFTGLHPNRFQVQPRISFLVQRWPADRLQFRHGYQRLQRARHISIHLMDLVKRHGFSFFDQHAVRWLFASGRPAGSESDSRTWRRRGRGCLLRDTHREKKEAAMTVHSVLAIGCHPDDIELGCAGALLKHRSCGQRTSMLVMTGGQRSRTFSGDIRRKEQEAAASILGAELFWGGFNDTEIDPGRATIDVIEDVMEQVNPDVVYVHAPDDSHQDHRAIAVATVSAARRTSRILFYQTPSTTHFEPTIFIDAEENLERKIAALECHASQVEAGSFHVDAVRASARYWGAFARVSFAEAFTPVRFVWDIAPSFTLHDSLAQVDFAREDVLGSTKGVAATPQ